MHLTNKDLTKDSRHCWTVPGEQLDRSVDMHLQVGIVELLLVVHKRRERLLVCHLIVVRVLASRVEYARIEGPRSEVSLRVFFTDLRF